MLAIKSEVLYYLCVYSSIGVIMCAQNLNKLSQRTCQIHYAIKNKNITSA